MTDEGTTLRAIFEQLERASDKLDHYFPIYERHFARFIGKSPRILEIGTQSGGSAEMWHTYFGEGTTIVGVDLAPLSAETDYFRLVVGDQGSEAFWRKEFAGVHDYFDIVIDDGSHDNPHQIVTLLHTYPMLRDGGIYWCEDTHTSYYHNVRVADGGYKNPLSFTEFVKDVVDVLSVEHTRYAIGVGPIEGPRLPPMLVAQFGRIQGVHFYDSIVAIDKGQPYSYRRAIHSADGSTNYYDSE